MNPIEHIRCQCLKRGERRPRTPLAESLQQLLEKSPDEQTRAVIERALEQVRKHQR